MKLKKVSRVLSLVVAGAMVLAMAPAAFAAHANCKHIGQHPVDNHDGTCSYVCNNCKAVIDTQAHVYQDYNGKTTCVRCDATCNHVGVQNVVDNGDGTHNVVCSTCKKGLGTAVHSYDKDGKCACGAEEPGTTYIPVDATHHRVHTVDQNGKVTYNEDAACNFETGTCICGNTCKHVGVQKVVDNGDGTHNVVCSTCNNKVVDKAEHSYGKDGKCACGATCNHEGVQKVVDNGDGTHNVVCPTCNEVLGKAEHVYGKDGKCACGATCNHEGVQKVVDNGDGTHNVVCPTCNEVLGTAEHSYDKDGKCACGAVKPEEPGTTYIPVDATHHRVHTVDENGKVTYDEVAACVFETGTCICGNTCNHVGAQKVVDNGDGTHNIVCPTCGEVLGTANHVYGEDGKGTCACGAKFTCDHMGQHFKFVDNKDGTHNVLCADCGAVVSENVPCTYVDGKCQQCGAAQPAPVPTPGSSVSPVATALGLGTWLLILGGLVLGFFGL